MHRGTVGIRRPGDHAGPGRGTGSCAPDRCHRRRRGAGRSGRARRPQAGRHPAFDGLLLPGQCPAVGQRGLPKAEGREGGAQGFARDGRNGCQRGGRGTGKRGRSAGRPRATPEKNLISRLGVLCIEIDKRVASMVGFAEQYGLICGGEIASRSGALKHDLAVWAT